MTVKRKTMSLINVLKCASIEESKEELRRVIQNAVDQHTGSVFTVGLSGGSLPTILAEVLPKITTDWKKWKFFFCDERLVSFSDPESTFGAYRSILVPKIADLSLNQFVTIDPSLKAWNSAYDYLSKMKQVFSRKIEVALPQFDLLFLGMGPDGHTCSLFPNHPLLGVCHIIFKNGYNFVSPIFSLFSLTGRQTLDFVYWRLTKTTPKSNHHDAACFE